MAEEKPLLIYIVAGEASGDLLGAHLMAALKKLSTQPIRFHGIGGERMAEEGLVSLFPYHELSRMGFLEVLPSALKTLARIHQTVEDVVAKQPDIIITIDVPGFSLRLVEKLRREKLHAKFIHYVAPTVWVYNAWRAKTCAKLFDHMLCLLPFEPPYFEKEGLPTTFVGHPVVAETTKGDGKKFREQFDISDDTTLMCLLPGSRRGEIKRHMPILARAITLLAAQYPKLALAVAVPKRMIPHVTPYLDRCPYKAVIIANDEDKKNAIAASNFAIVKSGTVALEVALAGTPMLVTYRVNALSAWALRRIATVKHANLINILASAEVIPELLQELCEPNAIANAAAALMEDTKRQNEQRAQARQALLMLVPPTHPSILAAEKILHLLP